MRVTCSSPFGATLSTTLGAFTTLGTAFAGMLHDLAPLLGAKLAVTIRIEPIAHCFATLLELLTMLPHARLKRLAGCFLLAIADLAVAVGIVLLNDLVADLTARGIGSMIAIKSILAAIPHVFTPVADVLDLVADAAIVLGIANILAAVTHILAAVTHVLAAIAHVFTPVALHRARSMRSTSSSGTTSVTATTSSGAFRGFTTSHSHRAEQDTCGHPYDQGFCLHGYKNPAPQTKLQKKRKQAPSARRHSLGETADQRGQIRRASAVGRQDRLLLQRDDVIDAGLRQFEHRRHLGG